MYKVVVNAFGASDRLQVVELPDITPDHLVVTGERKWWRDIRRLTQGKGADVIFDPIAAGEFLNQEIRLLANQGSLWIYGLLGQPDIVDVTPLIRKSAAIRGWLVNELSGTQQEQAAYQHVLESVANQTYKLPVSAKFSLQDVRHAHEAMEQGQHIGKLILIP